MTTDPLKVAAEALDPSEVWFEHLNDFMNRIAAVSRRLNEPQIMADYQRQITEAAQMPDDLADDAEVAEAMDRLRTWWLDVMALRLADLKVMEMCAADRKERER